MKSKSLTAKLLPSLFLLALSLVLLVINRSHVSDTQFIALSLSVTAIAVLIVIDAVQKKKKSELSNR